MKGSRVSQCMDLRHPRSAHPKKEAMESEDFILTIAIPLKTVGKLSLVGIFSSRSLVSSLLLSRPSVSSPFLASQILSRDLPSFLCTYLTVTVYTLVTPWNNVVSYLLPFHDSISRSCRKLEFINSYLCGLMHVAFTFGNKYIIIFIDDDTSICWVYLLKWKSQAFETFKKIYV